MWKAREIFEASRTVDKERLEAREGSSPKTDAWNFLRNTVWWATRRPVWALWLTVGNILHTLVQTPKWIRDVIKKTKNSIADTFSGVGQASWFKKWVNAGLATVYSVGALWEWVLRSAWEVAWALPIRLMNIGNNLTINAGEIGRSMWTIDPASKAKFLHYEKRKPQHFKLWFKNAKKWMFGGMWGWRADAWPVDAEPVDVWDVAEE